ncbi:tape measure protein [Pseudomonas sp. GWSMS-1]|uniref:tape measure protein n=1 Tax=Pseudomonas sp. GWSMS-1 TaxID=3308997 RepID=UPI003CF2E6BA
MARKAEAQLVISGENKTRAAFTEVNNSLSEMNKRVNSAAVALKGLIGVSVLKGAAVQYASLADQAKQIDARLKLATKSQVEFNKASADVRRIANENGAALGAVTQLYARLAPSLREAGRSQAEISQVVEAVTKSLRISGASAAESEGAITQFAQALGAGALRGDEFNSIAEAAPRLMQALAASLGVPVGALRDMAKAGQLTADVVANALIQQLPQLTKEAEEFGLMIGTSAQQLENAALDMVGAFDRLTGASARAAKSMSEAAAAANGLSSGEKPIENIARLLKEVARLTPQASLFFAAADKGLGALGLTGKKALDEIASAAKTYQLQLDAIEKEQVDKDIRRLADEQKAAADIAGIKYDEIAALKDWAESMGEVYEDFIAREQERHRLRVAGDMSANKLVADARKSGLADLKKDMDSQLKLLEAENKRLAKARENTLSIEREFNLLASEIRAGGGSSEPTYAAAQDALIAARQAKQRGDNKLAIEQARQAGEIIKGIQQSGQNTYGLAGMADELGRIAVEASKLDEVSVEKDVAAVSARINDLAKQAEALKVVNIEVQIDETNVEQVKARMQQLAADIAKLLVIQPVISAGGEQVAPLPGFATGTNNAPPGYAWVGERGPELVNFQGGEQVLTATASRLLASRSAGVDPLMTEVLANSAPNFPDLGRVAFELGGESVNVYASPGEALNLQRLAMKHGRKR